jgi:hypothetical protein
MNERIRKLAEQAGLKQRIWNSLGKELPMWQEDPDNPGLEKFAELIVAECGDVAYNAYWENPETVRGIHIKEKIKQHFGVKL